MLLYNIEHFAAVTPVVDCRLPIESYLNTAALARSMTVYFSLGIILE
jgi:hypothetical protein